MAKILVIGAGGQLGTELTKLLANTYGNEAVIATDFQESVKDKFEYCSFQTLNVMDKNALEMIIVKEKTKCIYHENQTNFSLNSNSNNDLILR